LRHPVDRAADRLQPVLPEPGAASLAALRAELDASRQTRGFRHRVPSRNHLVAIVGRGPVALRS
jgi:hypothetical protein